MSILLKALLVALVCLPIFIPLAHADTVAPEPVNDLEDAELQLLAAQTCQEVEDIQGGLSQTWAIVGVILVVLLVVGVLV